MTKPAPTVYYAAARPEAYTDERVYIREQWNDASDEQVSVALARVEPGVSTARHVVAVDERYLVVAGRGRMEMDGLAPAEVGSGDVVFIPSGTAQRITNIGASDLVFYCVCTPRFTWERYRAHDK